MRAVGVTVRIRHRSRLIASAAGSPVEPELRKLPSIKPGRACCRAGARSLERNGVSHQPLHTGSRSSVRLRDDRMARARAYRRYRAISLEVWAVTQWTPTTSARHTPMPVLKSLESTIFSIASSIQGQCCRSSQGVRPIGAIGIRISAQRDLADELPARWAVLAGNGKSFATTRGESDAGRFAWALLRVDDTVMWIPFTPVSPELSTFRVTRSGTLLRRKSVN